MPVPLQTPAASSALLPQLALASGAWGFLLLAYSPARSSVFSLGVTLIWLTTLFVVALRTFRRPSATVNLGLLGAFILAPWQIDASLGVAHYSYAETPAWSDWLTYTLVHVIGAADLLDVAASFDLGFQQIAPAALMAKSMLVWLRIAVDVALFGLVAGIAREAIVQARTRLPTGEHRFARKGINLAQFMSQCWFNDEWPQVVATFRKVRRSYLRVVLIFCAAVAFFQGWPASQWLLWPLDNGLRLLDFAGAMDIFGWRLYDRVDGFWASMAGVLFRLMIGVYVAEWATYLSLRYLGARSLRTVDDFIASLGDPGTREFARQALVEVGRDSIGKLVETLAGRDADLAQEARVTLDQIDPVWPRSAEAQAMLPVLLELLADEAGKEGFDGAATALGLLGNRAALPGLVRALASDHLAVQAAAAKALPAIDAQWSQSAEAQQQAPALLKALADPDSSRVRRGAAEALGEIRPPRAVAALTARLADDNERVRTAAVQALRRFGSAAAEAVPALASIIVNAKPGADDWQAAATTVGQIGPQACEALPALICSLASTGRSELVAVLNAIDPAWPAHEATQAAMRALLGKKAAEFRREDLSMLEALGQAARPALPAVIRLAFNKNTQWRALCALDAIDPRWRETPEAAAAIAPSIALLKGPPSPMRSAALATLRCFGPAATPAVGLLTSLLATAEDRCAAMNALTAIGPAAAPAVPTLLQALADNCDAYDAVRALYAIDARWAGKPAGQAAIADFLQGLSSRNEKVIESVICTLGQLGSEARAAELWLLRELARPRGRRPALVVRALNRVAPGWDASPVGRDAISAFLGRLATDEDGSGEILAAVEHLAPAAQSAAPLLLQRLNARRDGPAEILEALDALDPAWREREATVARDC